MHIAIKNLSLYLIHYLYRLWYAIALFIVWNSNTFFIFHVSLSVHDVFYFKVINLESLLSEDPSITNIIFGLNAGGHVGNVAITVLTRSISNTSFSTNFNILFAMLLEKEIFLNNKYKVFQVSFSKFLSFELVASVKTYFCHLLTACLPPSH